ncbi:fibronectin type III domain-containing protein [Mesonia sp. K4-1]|uniref:fibronectin type III domain-containing protein n=1 Tax=Mesonia sp. K4-1 TaxID=2602760 RepID=UPI0011CA3759|nr:fibronectin type III domain-containing protein [Mesonia sp. K4-1]TXK73035.1 T9SS type A sorting domain-containing protein [Mesonia sp. K4-1]
MKKITLLIFFTLLGITTSWSQISTYYTFSESSGTYIPITGGTVTSAITGDSDDGEELSVPIGFTLNYAGTSYSDLTIGVNGAISFTNNDVSFTNDLSATGVAQIDVIAPLWDDLYHRSSDGAEIRYETSGTSPNQTFTVQWTNISWRTTGNNTSFQLVLYEDSNNIQFNYGPNTSTDSRTASIGFNKGNSGSNFISVTPGVPGAASTSTDNNSISSSDYPGDGVTYIFTYAAPTCITPTNAQNTLLAATTADFTWDAEATATSGYNWAVMADGDDPTTDTPVASGTAATGTTLAQATGLTANTDYDFYVQSNCGATNGLSSWSVKVDFITPCATFIATPSSPFVEEFTATTIPACWSQTSDWEFSGSIGWNTSGCSAIPSDNTAGGGGSYAAVDMSDITTTETIVLELPLVDVSALTAPSLNFYMFMCTQGYNPPNELHIEAYDGTTWNQVGIVDTGSASWENHKFILLNHVVGNTVQLRFRVQEQSSSSSYYGDIAIDDVMIEEGPSCLKPTNIVNAAVTANTADFTWDAPAILPSNGYEWVVMASGSPAPDISTSISTGTATTNSTTAGSLTQVTSYVFYVRSDCGGTDQSAWEGPLSFTTGCPSQLAGNYTIGTTGDYTSISAAISDLNACGVSAAVTFDILTGSGPYNEQLVLNEVTGASATNTITFNGNGETITSATDTSNRSLFLLDGVDYVTLNNINFLTQDVDNNFVIQLTNGANFNSITNNTIDLTSAIDDTGSDNAGIVVSGSLTSATSDGDSGNVTITGNTIIGGYYGISISGQSTGSSMDNTISDNTIQDFYYYGIYNNDVENTTIISNDLHRENRTNVSNFYALYFTGNGGGNIINANMLHDAFTGEPSATSAAYPIYHTSTDAAAGNANIVSNNIIYNINGAGGTNYAIYNSGSDGVHYYHNTITLDFQGASSGTTRGFYQTTTASDIEFINNIVSITRGGSGTKYCLYFNTSGSSIISNYNVLHMDAPAGTNHIGYSGSAQTTLSDWQTATGGDTNSVDVDLLFAAPATGQLEPNNPAVDNIGTPLASVTMDINGNARSVTAPDIGAFEFTPASCILPTGIMANNITDSSADIIWTGNNTPAATEWEIEYGPVGYTQGSAAAIATINDNDGTLGETLTGLTGSTDYDVYVRTICSSTSSSAWTGPFTFTTLCSPITAPFFDDVETHTATATNPVEDSECWYTIQGSYEWQISDDDTTSSGTGPNQANSGTNFFFTEGSSGLAGDVAELYSPFLDISSLSFPALEFYYHMFNGSTIGDMGELHIDVHDGSTWNNDVMTPIVGGQQAAQADPWVLQTVDLSAYSGTIQIRFRALRGNDYESDISIDDISVFDFNCVAPTNVVVSSITTTAADFSWTASPDETNGYEYIVMLDGENPDMDTPAASGILSTGNTMVSVSGLSPGVAYDFYVRTICSLDGPWSPVVDFTTALPPCDLPTGITNTAVTLTTADFSWTASADETNGYIWLVMADGDDPLVDMPLDDGTVATGVTTLTVNGLTPATNYDFYIQTDCGGGTLSIVSNKVDFMTDNYPCTPPASISNNAITGTTAKLTWQTNGLETGGYNWVLMADGDDPTTDMPLFNGSVGTGVTSVIISGLTPMTDYDFYVQTVCATEDSGWSSKVDITTTAPPCAEPSGVVNTDVQSSTADFDWTASPDESNGYNWVLMADGEDPTIDTPLFNGNVATGVTSVSISGLTSMTDYDFYVQTLCGSGNLSDWSTKVDITTLASACAAPTGVMNTDVQNTTADFSWAASPDETGGYSWVVMTEGEDPMVDSPVQQGAVATGVTNIQVTGLTKDTEYDFYVRTDCGSGNMSDWSTKVDFITTDLKTSISNFQNFSYYPNPVKSTLVLEASIQEMQKVSVYNLLGQEVISIQPNSFKTNLNLEKLAAGPYMIMVTINGELKTFKVIKE